MHLYLLCRPQHVATLTDSPSRAEIKSFFSFLAAFVSPPAPLRQLKQQQQHLPYQQQPPAGPSLSEALDGVMFLAACAVSHQWGLSIEPASKWSQGSCQGDASAGGLERPPKQQQRRRDDWLLLCGTPSSPCSAETVSVRALTWFFNSLRQFVPRYGPWLLLIFIFFRSPVLKEAFLSIFDIILTNSSSAAPVATAWW